MAAIDDILWQLVDALYGLLRLGATHGDLKPINILVMEEKDQVPRLAIVDLGSAIPLRTTCRSFRPIHRCCTYPYAPPEYFEEESDDAWRDVVSHDAYSLGIVLYEIIYKGHLIEWRPDATYHSVRDQHRSGKARLDGEQPKGVPPLAFAAMSALLEPDPERRASIPALRAVLLKARCCLGQGGPTVPTTWGEPWTVTRMQEELAGFLGAGTVAGMDPGELPEDARTRSKCANVLDTGLRALVVDPDNIEPWHGNRALAVSFLVDAANASAQAALSCNLADRMASTCRRPCTQAEMRAAALVADVLTRPAIDRARVDAQTQEAVVVLLEALRGRVFVDTAYTLSHRLAGSLSHRLAGSLSDSAPGTRCSIDCMLTGRIKRAYRDKLACKRRMLKALVNGRGRTLDTLGHLFAAS
jgi:hypothetical protein